MDNTYDRSNSGSPDNIPPAPSPPRLSEHHDTYSRNRNSRRSPSPPRHASSRRKRSHSRERTRDRDRERERRGSKYSSSTKSRNRSRSRSRERRRSSGEDKKSSHKEHKRSTHQYHHSSGHSNSMPSNFKSFPVTRLPPQPVQSNAFKNDGSFMEMFKKLQEQTAQQEPQPTTTLLEEKPAAPPPLFVGKRRGGRILKTGMVAKPKVEANTETPKDAWSLYMAESIDCEIKMVDPKVRFAGLNFDKMTDEQLQSKMWTAPPDSRFPNTNKTRYCYQSYLDFHRCKKARGEEFEACKYFKRVYGSMCPLKWTEKWDEQITNGNFPGRI